MPPIIPPAPAEVPEAYWAAADASNYFPRPQAQGGTYRLVVIHITSGHADPYGTADMFRQPATPTNRPRSAHFIVSSDIVLQCVPLRFAAQHAHACNAFSVGIEHTVREPREFGPNDKGLPPTPELYARSARLTAYLLKAAGLPVVRGQTIEGHNKADPQTTHTGCPDAGPWDWTWYLQLVQAAYDKLPLISTQ